MRIAAILVALALVPSDSGAATRARYQMGTVCEIAAERPGQIEAAFAEAARIERLLSTWTDGSELARVNRREIEPGPELRALLDTTLVWSERTNRAFDPRIGHLVAQFRSGAGLPPGPSRAQRASGVLKSDGGAPAIQPQFEEGAFGKGYALDRMLALISGDTVINFGGQILVRGMHEVTIADPRDRNTPVITFVLTNASLSTSANSEQLHIIDPRTGALLPARGSVSVVARDALAADILSTALYVMGEDDGLRWAAANDVAAIFIGAQRTIRLSPAARALGVAVIDRDFEFKD